MIDSSGLKIWWDVVATCTLLFDKLENALEGSMFGRLSVGGYKVEISKQDNKKIHIEYARPANPIVTLIYQSSGPRTYFIGLQLKFGDYTVWNWRNFHFCETIRLGRLTYPKAETRYKFMPPAVKNGFWQAAIEEFIVYPNKLREDNIPLWPGAGEKNEFCQKSSRRWGKAKEEAIDALNQPDRIMAMDKIHKLRPVIGVEEILHNSVYFSELDYFWQQFAGKEG